MISISVLLAATALAAPAADAAPADRFFDALRGLCGQSFAGKVVTQDEADAAFRSAALVMTVARCDDREIRIPFRVGEDRSRTWVVSRPGDGRLRLKHDHRHADGTEDELSRYGGDSAAGGSASVQDFPVDAASQATFTRLGRSVSNTNVWSLSVTDTVFSYQLARPGRLFRVEFDLTRPLAPKPD